MQELARPQPYLGTEVFIPIAIAASGTGSGGTYTIDGVASFFFAGYVQVCQRQPEEQGGLHEPSGLCTGKCNGSTTYIWGWFTSDIVPGRDRHRHRPVAWRLRRRTRRVTQQSTTSAVLPGGESNL